MNKSANMGRPVTNKYGVSKRQWNKWSNAAKRVFNRVFHEMRHQWIFLHPAASVLSREHWMTTRWNAAWIAANAVDRLPPYTQIFPVDRTGKAVGMPEKVRA